MPIDDEKRFVRLPLTVRDDQSLSFAAVMTYTHLAEIEHDGQAVISLAALATRQRRKRSTISASLRQLVTAGHIEPVEGRAGRVGIYRLTHPVFRTGTHPENRTTPSRKLDGTHPENRTQS